MKTFYDVCWEEWKILKSSGLLGAVYTAIVIWSKRQSSRGDYLQDTFAVTSPWLVVLHHWDDGTGEKYQCGAHDLFIKFLSLFRWQMRCGGGERGNIPRGLRAPFCLKFKPNRLWALEKRVVSGREKCQSRRIRSLCPQKQNLYRRHLHYNFLGFYCRLMTLFGDSPLDINSITDDEHESEWKFLFRVRNGPCNGCVRRILKINKQKEWRMNNWGSDRIKFSVWWLKWSGLRPSLSITSPSCLALIHTRFRDKHSESIIHRAPKVNSRTLKR